MNRPYERAGGLRHGSAQAKTNPPASIRLLRPRRLFCHHLHPDRRCILSSIAVGEGLAPPAVALTPVGQIVEEQIQAIPARHPAIGIEKYVIMPNHVHLLVSIRDLSGGASPSPTVGTEASSSEGDLLPSLFDVVRVLKSLTTRMARPFLGENPLWQRSYHEHVIRNEEDYRQIWEYIDTNPAKWAEDRYYSG